MQYSVTFIHKLNKKQFIISNKTKSHLLKQLIKKAFHFQNDIRYVRPLGGGAPLQIHEIFNFSNQNQFQIILQDQSDDKSRSQNCSQKNMSKLSGRKHPPSQRQLLQSKFYIDDFQLFMSQIDSSKANRYFGIVFFSNRKKTVFLGKKILRQLVFQFDQIQFFYALHPIKMHNTSALLGQTLVFSLFKGKKMVHQRQFPEQITAAEEIISYLKNLIKVGDLSFKKGKVDKNTKRSKNLISVCQQRSFDQKNDVLPKQKQYEEKNLTQFFKIKEITPIKLHQITPIRHENHIKSPITNQISFETQFYQPQWFRQGDALNRLQKSYLSALIKQNNQVLINFCQGLELKKSQKQNLNKKLLKVFLQQLINEKLSNHLTDTQLQTISNNQQNRKSFVFSALLKLNKFGDIESFIQTMKRNLETQTIQFDMNREQINQRKNSYLQLAKQIKSKQKSFTLKLMQPDQLRQPNSPVKQRIQLIGQHSNLNQKNQQIAMNFHNKQIPLSYLKQIKKYQINFSDQYTEADSAHIRQLINNGDAFLIQNFIPHENSNKKFNKMPAEVVKKYIKSIEPRYANLRERTSLSNFCKSKLHKLQIFMSLLYFIYKNRHITRKQLKAFFYLYIWSDLNILSTFQVYLQDRDVNEFLDTLYSIDYTYYLNGKYGIDMNEVENFTIQIQSQLIMLFLLSDKIPSIYQRLAVEKFIRAGDITLQKIYHNFDLVGQEFTQKALQMCKEKRKNLQQHSKNQNKEEMRRIQRNKQRCNFIEQIKPVHFKTFNSIDIVHECINNDQPRIHEIFDIYDKNNQLVKWIDSFSEYIQNLDSYHMEVLLKNVAAENNIDYQRVKTAKNDLLKGIYESYMITKDKQDLVDSLEHIIKKIQRDQRSLSSPLKSP